MLPPGVPYQFRAVPGVPGALEPFYYFPYDQSAVAGQYFPKMNIMPGTTIILPPGTAPSGAQQLHVTQLPVQAVQVPTSSSPSTPSSSSDPATSAASQEGSASESKQPV
jgi:hypothetical protein